MSGLQASLNDEFLRTFLPETIYLVEGEVALPAPELDTALVPPAPAQQHADTVPATTVPAEEPNPVHKLAAIPKIPKKEPAPIQKKYKVLGENRKGVVVLVTLPDNEFMQLPQLDFLQKILRAIGLQPEDVAYVNNLSGDTARFEDLQVEASVSYIISFASRLDTDQPHDKFTLYNPVKIGTVPIVFSQALKMLKNDVEHKKLLWGALQKVFL